MTHPTKFLLLRLAVIAAILGPILYFANESGKRHHADEVRKGRAAADDDPHGRNLAGLRHDGGATR